ncbi:MAG: hypothetical protein COW01_13945 [Bdellovibrionales bacterium CG12_big_fil_rev_8_21_14_0_65_38_15]|nr:MAG: hypothetical protein COW79_16765 [Bdellovibrionales bacterium CG22_combo_CG10-13_8_21_14_all_38_13]PIQ53374.1 MAG: hypothetical protein COW01_13945 [Bdellovibrionales bacterium CG12_big_fil_rev_8_21_14_0_65_38_15]PIR30263.1 MAG: hypothetical protein COV38_05810 [Bdellovibrionales bacterium CG11_big_fil_rev_8_21_14_0_20_38_13]
MLEKHGSQLKSNTQNENIILINPEGHQFQISHTAHMVWNMLDGQTEVKTIANKIGTIAEIDAPKMEGLVLEIISGLKEVDLVG